VIPPTLIASHIQREWEWDVRRTAFELLAKRATVIRYDSRGLGLSPHEPLDFSAEAAILDLTAVVERLGLDRFALYATQWGGDVIFAYPAHHPERVSHLIVSVPPVPREFFRQVAVVRAIADEDWNLFTEILARITGGWDFPEAPMVAAVYREHTRDSFDMAAQAIRSSFLPPDTLLAAIRAATLILHSTGSNQDNHLEVAQRLAGAIPGAHMIGIPGIPVGSSINETVVSAVLDFINTAPAAPGAPIPPPQVDISAVRTIVFTDVEGSTALNERLGDEGARQVLREHERLTREALGAHGGSEVKAMGDGFMAWFPSATRAVDCAIALQRSLNSQLATHNSAIRIGINAGEPIAEGDDLFGASVIAAARIAAAALGGQILAADVVRQLLAGKGFSFTDQGEHSLKGFDEPARLYEVRWRENA
jgi:class 3 adenylate cyclase/pimeloyl-ACP methyl ester carboxylesterase